MRCNEVEAGLSAYVDREMDAGSAKDIEEHVGGCARCKALLDSLLEMDRLLRGAPGIDPPPGFARKTARIALEGDAHHFVRERPKGLLGWVEVFFSFFEKPSHIRSLDEFDDFPPCSIGWAYFRLLGQTGGGR